MHNYADTYLMFPQAYNAGWGQNAGRQYSWVMKILPQIEQGPLFNVLSAKGNDPVAGNRLADPWSSQAYWNLDIPAMICPSDSKPGNRNESPSLLNYRVCVGDTLQGNDNGNTRGIFRRNVCRTFGDINDGTSNTIMLGESLLGSSEFDVLGGVAVGVAGSNPQACIARIDPANPRRLTGAVRADFRPQGGRAWDGRPYFTAFATAVAPNGPFCQSSGVDGGWGHSTAQSRHTGGVQVAMADGSVRFVSENINSGDRTSCSPGSTGCNVGPQSPYGIWGALGTMSGGEAVGDF